MQVEERIKLCAIIEKMYFHQNYSQKLGLQNKSQFSNTNKKEKEIEK